MKTTLNIKALFFNLLIISFISCEVTENSINDDEDGTEIVDDNNTDEEPTSEDDNTNDETLFTGTKTFNASGSGNGTLGTTCTYDFTSVTDNLELSLNFEDSVLISGTYSLDIKTEAGTLTSIIEGDTTCSDPKTFNETKTGDLIVSSNGAISFTTNIGTSVNLTNVTYTFNGTATETSYTGTIQQASNLLQQTITYNLDSDIVHSSTTLNASNSGNGTLTLFSTCEYPFTSNTSSLVLELNFEDDVLVSGDYTLNINTAVGTGTSINGQAVCTHDPTFTETHEGNLTVGIDNTISFNINIGTSINLSNVTYSFDGTASETTYSGSIDHFSPSLSETIEYEITTSIAEASE